MGQLLGGQKKAGFRGRKAPTGALQKLMIRWTSWAEKKADNCLPSSIWSRNSRPPPESFKKSKDPNFKINNISTYLYTMGNGTSFWSSKKLVFIKKKEKARASGWSAARTPPGLHNPRRGKGTLGTECTRRNTVILPPNPLIPLQNLLC